MEPSGKPDSSSDDYQTCSEGVCVDSSECKNYGAGKLDFRWEVVDNSIFDF